MTQLLVSRRYTSPRNIQSLSYRQAQVADCEVRNVVMVAGRRFGKTTKSVVRTAKKMLAKRNQYCWYIAPTYKLGKELFWRPFKEFFPPEYIRYKNESDLLIELWNGSRGIIKGADNPDSLRGSGVDDATYDEFADMDPYTVEVMRPALSDKQGSQLFLGTPRGYDHFYDLYTRGEYWPDNEAKWRNWRSFRFTTLQGGRVPPEEVALAREELDPRIFRQEYEASFETLLGRIYYAFARAQWPVGNVDVHVKDQGGPLLVGLDFNVHPMSAVIAQAKHKVQCHVLDEVVLPTSNTDEMCKVLKEKYPDREMIVCPDASGDSTSTKAPVGESDFTILRRHGFKIVADKSNPKIADRYNNTNSNLLNANNLRRTRIHPRCKWLIKGLEGLVYKKDASGQTTPLPDKKSGLDHITDALGYVLFQQFNVFDRVAKIHEPELGELFSPYEN